MVGFMANQRPRRQLLSPTTHVHKLPVLCSVQAAAGDDEELQGILQKHLLRGAGAEAVDALLRFHVRHSWDRTPEFVKH
jgi:hypothetical protein